KGSFLADPLRRGTEVVVTGAPRKRLVRKGTWVRIPPSPPPFARRSLRSRLRVASRQTLAALAATGGEPPDARCARGYGWRAALTSPLRSPLRVASPRAQSINRRRVAPAEAWAVL